jgi:methyl-accepting chemotaxis protein
VGVSALALCTVSWRAIAGLSTSRRAAARGQRADALVEDIETVDELVAKSAIEVRDHVIAETPDATRDVERRIAETDARLDAAMRIVTDEADPSVDQLVVELGHDLAQLRAIRDQQLIPASERDDVTTGRAVIAEDMAPTTEDIATLTTALTDAARAEAAATLAAGSASYSATRLSLLVLFAVATADTAAFGALVTRAVSRPLRASAALLDKVAGGDLTVRPAVESSDWPSKASRATASGPSGR